MKWLLPVFFTVLTACSEERNITTSCPTETNYSSAFLESDFYRGWRVLAEGQSPREHCEEALRYFRKGVDQPSVFELSALYVDFCSAGKDDNLLSRSSIYRADKQPTGVDYDEFKWMLDLALCNSPVEQYALGQMLLNGFITDRDTEKGIYFLSLAAHQEHIQAQLALAQALYERGEEDVAARWQQKAHYNLTMAVTSNGKNAE